jgi:predicted CXXCH cytochrome family protein
MRLGLLLLIGASLLDAAVPGNEYVDTRTCATCHQKIAETYRRTGMGRSLYKPTAANTVEDYKKNHEFVHALSGTHYSMIVRDGQFYQRRWQIGFDGKETNVEEMKIDDVIGSGNHSRSYLHRMANGGYIELPLSWYSEKGGYWAMSPGFDSHHPPTRRFVSYECVSCHDAAPEIPAGHNSPASDPIFASDLPQGIDCQRCHGPGGTHLRVVKSAGSTLKDVRASIVNPAWLSPSLQMDLCMQCHLEPTSSEIPALIRRFNRGPFSFVPGEPLSAFLLAFDHAPGTSHDDKFEIVNSSAYRLRKSQCFIKSKGAMTCLTCHDPHSVPRGAEAVSYYSGVCRQCHGSAIDAQIASGRHPAATECISCHMPKRRTEDVVHAVMTDHLIQRRLPPRDLLADLPERHPSDAEEYRGEVVPYYPSPLPHTDDNDLYLAVAQVALRNNLQKGVLELAREVDRVQPREAQFYMVLGDAWQSSGKPQEAVGAYEDALRLRPDSVHGLLALAGALKASGQVSLAANKLDQAIRMFPSDASAWFQAGALDYSLGRTLEAISKMEKALALDPDLAGGHRGLGELLWRTGQIDRSESELRLALDVDPYDAEAYDLMGRVLAGKSQMAEALFDFEKATKLGPRHAPYLYDYALALTGVNRPDDAQTPVEAAVHADPNMAEAHELLGGLLAGKRLLSEAAHEYAEAIRLKPDFARAHLDLARVLVAQGDTAGAIEQLRKAAAGSDPQVAQIASRALQGIGK